ncbi:wall-associated receptor kinase 2-like protein [Cinnamomum micranthum f. kanehirae]|uniref:Wall-associated receptor kinase 2-like protein n=1 Tax=Cinnamomum micranthum f. kanehirae TaxID=337451 RepID=A0A443NMR3_9MAGN|nr:wall-associated receptor kinase 2-like protein [Cinnamomum micranthum f. kanehirae]
MSPFDFLFKKKKVKQSLLGRRQGKQGVLEDGARLLQALISASDGKAYYPLRMFSVEEIEEAIKETYPRISPNKEIGEAEETYETGIYASNYKGIYQGRQIFIKAYQGEREYAFNEIATITQINHANVVKLLGCCLEMEFPLLVYELVANSLRHRLHESNSLGPIPWEYRLRIATEIANAITYLHIANPKPIVHRNITSSNILLDEHCRPKLCGFTLTVTIPLGETHVKMEDISGTFGYLDPDYRVTRIVSAKTDVYGFGMLLFELLSGKKPEELITIDDMHGLCKIERDEIIQWILDNGLSMDPRQVEQSVACTELVSRCISREPDQRPPMKEVAQQLQLIERYELPSSSSSSSLAGVQQLQE